MLPRRSHGPGRCWCHEPDRPPRDAGAARPALGRAAAGPDVDIVVPVYNEEAALEGGIRRLHRLLTESFPFGRRIVIADNASTDVARRLLGRLRGVEYLRLERKGRGRALRAAWSRSDARVVAYMDVDLSATPSARRSSGTSRRTRDRRSTSSPPAAR